MTLGLAQLARPVALPLLPALGLGLWLLAPDGKRLLFGAGMGTSDYLMAVDPSSAGTVTRISKITDTSAFGVSDDGKKVVSIRPSGQLPAEVFVNDTPLTNLNPEARQYAAMFRNWIARSGRRNRGEVE